MKMKAILTLAILTFTSFGCGQNPTNRESNPIKHYQGLKQDGFYPAGKPKVILAKEDDSEHFSCANPYTLKISDGDLDVGRTLQYAAGSQKIYRVEVSSTYSPI